MAREVNVYLVVFKMNLKMLKLLADDTGTTTIGYSRERERAKWPTKYMFTIWPYLSTSNYKPRNPAPWTVNITIYKSDIIYIITMHLVYFQRL